MTRTVEDAALMMRVLSKPDRRDTMSLPYQDLPWTDLDLDLAGLRIGLMIEAGIGLPLAAEVRQAIEEAAGIFAAAGARVEPLAPFLTRSMLDGLDRFWRQRAWMDVGGLDDERRALVLPYIRTWAESGQALSGSDVYEGMHQMIVMRHAAVAASLPFDFVISPVSPVPAYDVDLPSPLNDPQRPFEHIGYTVAFNMSEQPAASINAGYTTEGLPIGLQIVGHRFDDVGVLRLSRAFERLRPSQRPWPRPS
jgi:aspartyl-tRNA(Asn)/glutamyl-tRNA(Gln) amidotransferase subunit A